jgi:metal-responsive CopG/Arc/MetJ family transcriptional regulator
MIHINENLHNVVTDKTKVTFTIDKTLMNRFRQVANKDMRKYSQIIEGSIKRYIQSKL